MCRSAGGGSDLEGKGLEGTRPGRSGEQGVAGIQLQHTFPCAVHPRREGRGHAQGSLPPRAAEAQAQAARRGKGKVSGLLQAGFADSCRLVEASSKFVLVEPGTHTGTDTVDKLGVGGAPLQVVKELSGWQPLELGELEAESEHEQEVLRERALIRQQGACQFACGSQGR